MFYKAELDFMRSALKKCHLQTLILDPYMPIDHRVDMGLHGLVQHSHTDTLNFYDLIGPVEKNTIYKLTDAFLCNYIFLSLPQAEKENIFLIGPYLSCEISDQQIMEICENAGILPRHIAQLEKYYGGVPLITDEAYIFSLLETLGERMWGSSKSFSVVDINKETSGAFSPFTPGKSSTIAEGSAWNAQILEERYAYENEMMEVVAQGQIHKVDMMLSAFSSMPFERRLSDPLRNFKNYCVIMNTLLRKAAESGGVHPLHLDSASSHFARRIESLTSVDHGQEFMSEIFRTYCHLVKKHSVKQYSSPVQKAITSIEADPTADLSLRALAASQNVSASYLSALFKQETGQTLTDYVNRRRIKLAMRLLETTSLQIQTIAQHCGILDVQYFSKLFKKYTEKTPKEYRESHIS